jgi:hypothetical protein
VLPARSQHREEERERERGRQHHDHVARLAVERRDQHAGEGDEARQRGRADAPHELVQLPHRHDAEREQAERPDLAALADDEEREEDRRDRDHDPWRQVGSRARLPHRGHA